MIDSCFLLSLPQVRQELVLRPDQPVRAEGGGRAAEPGAERGHPDGAVGAAELAAPQQGHLRQGGRQDPVDQAQERAHTPLPGRGR